MSIRGRGHEVYTLRDVYGEQEAAKVSDTKWMREGTSAGRILLTKDYALRRLLMIVAASSGAGARVFCLANAHLSRDEISERYLNNLNRIVQRARHPGPYVYAVLTKTIELRWPLPK